MGIALTTCLFLLSNVSFSESITISKPSGLYISGKYKPSVSVFSNFSVKETNVVTKNLIGLKKDTDSISISDLNSHSSGIGNPSNFNIPYKPEFQDNFVSFSGAVGFLYAEGPRIEIEASYQEFDVKNPGGYTALDGFRCFALAREIDTNNSESKQPQQAQATGRVTTAFFIL